MFEKIIFIICSVVGAVNLEIMILWTHFLKNPYKNGFISKAFYENVNWEIWFVIIFLNTKLFNMQIYSVKGRK
jgi:hypothetical protein